MVGKTGGVHRRWRARRATSIACSPGHEFVERDIVVVVEVGRRRNGGSGRDYAYRLLRLCRRGGIFEHCKTITPSMPAEAERQGKGIPWSLSPRRASSTLLSVLIKEVCGTGAGRGNACEARKGFPDDMLGLKSIHYAMYMEKTRRRR